MGVGSFAPWATLGISSVSGTSGGGDGWFTLGAAAVLLVLGLSVMSSGRLSTGGRAVGYLVAMGGAAMGLYDMVNVQALIDESHDSLFFPSYGPGLPMVILGGVVALIGVNLAPRQAERPHGVEYE